MRIRASCSVSLLFLLRASRASAELEEEFRVLSPEEVNVTVANWTSGYNPWMPEYNGGNPNVTTYALLSGGCLPVEEKGSAFLQDATAGWQNRCNDLGMECVCRPILSVRNWNVQLPPDSGVLLNMHQCAFEIRRILDEHKRGLIKLGGISAACNLKQPEIYDEARELGVPVFLIDSNPPKPGDGFYGVSEPDGYISVDDVFMGRTLAKVLKQLRPQGGSYGFVMQWSVVGGTSFRRRAGFNEEMIVQPSDQDDVSVWNEIEPYPFEARYNASVDCPHLNCQMEGLAKNTSVNSVIFLYQTPAKNKLFKTWVDEHRSRNITLISVGTLDFIQYLNTGYLDGLVSQVSYDFGKRSAEVLLDTATKLASSEIYLPLKENFFETKLVSYNVIPLNLDKVHPPQLDQNLLGNLVYMGYTCFGIVLASALFSGIWIVYNRSAMVVRAAQPFFLLVLLLGIVIFASTIIPLSFDDGGDPDSVSESAAVGVCMSQPWLAFVGFAVIFSALFSKTWRVNKLFHSRTQRHSRIHVSTMDVLAPFAVTFTCNVIILTFWTVIDPLTYTRLLGDGTDFWNRGIESYGACRSDRALAFLVPLAVLNIAVLGIACWQAFEARNIESAFAEAKYIGWSVASLFQAFLTGFPILVIVNDEPRAFYAVLALMIFVLSEGILLLIFLPKMYMAFVFSSMTESEQKKAMSEQISRSSNLHLSKNAFGGSNLPENGSKFFRAMAPVNNVILEGPRDVSKDIIFEDEHHATLGSSDRRFPGSLGSSELHLARAARSLKDSEHDQNAFRPRRQALTPMTSNEPSSTVDPSSTVELSVVDVPTDPPEKYVEVSTKASPVAPMRTISSSCSESKNKENSSSSPSEAKVKAFSSPTSNTE